MNITFQRVAAQLCCLSSYITFKLVILYFLMFTSENYTKTIIRLIKA